MAERIEQPRSRAARRTSAGRGRACALLLAGMNVLTTAGADVATSNATIPYRVVADGVPEALTASPGDAERGRALIAARDPANCVLCHAVPSPAIPFAGDVGPSLAGVGARLSAAQLRLRVVDSQRVNGETAMPSYYRIDGLDLVAPAYRGKPILTATQVEDVVAYLSTLR